MELCWLSTSLSHLFAWQEDLCASLPEEKWFHAEQHKEELETLMRGYQGIQDLTCLDVFGFSGSITKAWRDKGFTAEKYDIALNPRSNDLLGKRGFLCLVRYLTVTLLGPFFS